MSVPKALDISEDFQTKHRETMRAFFGRLDWLPEIVNDGPNKYTDEQKEMVRQFYSVVLQALYTLPVEPCVIATPMLYRILKSNIPVYPAMCSYDVFRAYLCIFHSILGRMKHNPQIHWKTKFVKASMVVRQLAEAGLAQRRLTVVLMRLFEYFMWAMEAPDTDRILAYLPSKLEVHPEVDRRVQEITEERAKWLEMHQVKLPKCKNPEDADVSELDALLQTFYAHMDSI